MRSVFTVKLEARPGSVFPSDAEVVAALRGSGWEARRGPFWQYFCDDAIAASCPVVEEAAAEERVRLMWYREEANRVFKRMPELCEDDPEREAVIYFGRLAVLDAEFVVTRLVMGELKFRLLKDELVDLQSATDRVIRSVLRQSIFVEVSRSRVVIFEHGRDRVLLTGQVMRGTWREAYHRDSRDVLLTVVPLLLFLVAFPLDRTFGSLLASDIRSVFDRFATAMLTTAIVSALSFMNQLLRLARESVVVWEYGG